MTASGAGAPPSEPAAAQGAMSTFHFHAGLTFREVNALLRQVNAPGNRALIATLTWLDGVHANQSLTFLWDPYAERFGHQIDKSALDDEVFTCLSSDLPIRVTLHAPRGPH